MARLSRSATAALGTGAYALASSSIWRVADHSTGRGWSPSGCCPCSSSSPPASRARRPSGPRATLQTLAERLAKGEGARPRRGVARGARPVPVHRHRRRGLRDRGVPPAGRGARAGRPGRGRAPRPRGVRRARAVCEPGGDRRHGGRTARRPTSRWSRRRRAGSSPCYRPSASCAASPTARACRPTRRGGPSTRCSRRSPSASMPARSRIWWRACPSAPRAAAPRHGGERRSCDADAAPTRMLLEAFVRRIAEREGVGLGEARQRTRAVFETLREAVGKRQFLDVTAQLSRRVRHGRRPSLTTPARHERPPRCCAGAALIGTAACGEGGPGREKPWAWTLRRRASPGGSDREIRPVRAASNSGQGPPPASA